MSCGTCGHTMHGIGHAIFWCPRCGTLKHPDVEDEAPKLVKRCRDFEVRLIADRMLLERWKLSGIAESINIPDARPAMGKE